MSTLRRSPFTALLLLFVACTPPVSVSNPSESASTASQAVMSSTSVAMDTVSVDWTIDVAVDADETPHSTLSLVLSGALEKTIKLGTYTGYAIDGPEDVPDTLISMSSFWWAGGGDTIAVFHEEDRLIIKHQTVDEEGGFGEWKTLATVDLPEHASVVVQ